MEGNLLSEVSAGKLAGQLVFDPALSDKSDDGAVYQFFVDEIVDTFIEFSECTVCGKMCGEKSRTRAKQVIVGLERMIERVRSMTADGACLKG